MAPVLTIEAPARSAIVEGAEVEIVGRVDDGGGEVSVTAAGVEVEVSSDGEFRAPLSLAPGVNIIETVATDSAGNQTKDTRAVLGGPYAEIGKPVDEALYARLGVGALDAVGGALSSYLVEADFAALIGTDEIVDVGNGCFGVKAEVREVEKSGVSVRLSPTEGALQANVEIRDLHVRLRAKTKVLCDGDGTNVYMDADALRVSGGLTAGIAEDGALEIGLDELAVEFDNFDFDSGDLPGDLIDLAVGDIEDATVEAIEDALRDAVSDQASEVLSDLSSSTWELEILGKPITIAVAPRELVIDEGGLYVSLSGAIAADVAGEARYPTTSNPEPEADPEHPGFTVGLADDVVNQFLASLWASGRLGLSLGGEEVSDLLGEVVKRVEIALVLPPTVSLKEDGRTLSVMVGGGRVQLFGENGVLIDSSISLVLDIGIEMTEEGVMSLSVSKSQVWAEVLSQSAELAAPVGEELLEGLVEQGLTQLVGRADEALGEFPIPTVAAMTLEQLALSFAPGYAIVSAEVLAP